MRTLYKQPNGQWVVKYHSDDPEYNQIEGIFPGAIVPTPYHDCTLADVQRMDTRGILSDCAIGATI